VLERFDLDSQDKMETQIWKYPLRDTWYQELLMPKGSNIIHVGVQRNVICLWAEVDTEQKQLVKRAFYMVGTGNMWPPVQVRHIGSVIKKDTDKFSPWHVYQEITDWMTETERLKRLEEQK